MHIKSSFTNEEAPGACDSRELTDDTNDLNFATGTRDRKEFATLAARFAIAGYSLQRTDAKDGEVDYCAVRWGLARHLRSIEEANSFLLQIGGKL
jgi:hypothetical protein